MINNTLLSATKIEVDGEMCDCRVKFFARVSPFTYQLGIIKLQTNKVKKPLRQEIYVIGNSLEICIYILKRQVRFKLFLSCLFIFNFCIFYGKVLK